MADKNKPLKPLEGGVRYIDNPFGKGKIKVDTSDEGMAFEEFTDKEEETLIERLLREQKEDDDEITYDTVVGDRLPPLPQPQQQTSSSPSGKGGGLFRTLVGIGAKAALGAATGGAGTGIPMFIPAADGGQIKKKTTTKKKKRVLRGVGAAKRGYGKATYSKKMY